MLKITPQHDLKGRTPERSEWLVAGGVAKRTPRYRATNHNASERREYRLPWRLLSRLSDAFPWVIRHSEGYANAPPSAKSTRAKALGIQPFRLDTPAADNRSTTKVMPTNRGKAAKLTV